MSNVDRPTESDDDVIQLDLLKALADHGRTVIAVTLGVTAVVAVMGAANLYWWQPVRRVSMLEFRPTFTGASQGQYPNGLPFAASDVAAGSIMDIVYDVNSVKEYCQREVFRGGFFVEQRSDQSAFLDAEYQGRLAEARLTAVDRDRLVAEYQAKRAALPLQYRLMFVKPRECAAIPQIVVQKVMTDLRRRGRPRAGRRDVLRHAAAGLWLLPDS